MALAIFDLDNTLLGGDSDHAFGEFACEQGLVEAASFGRANDEFYADYQRGELDVNAYLAHALAPLAGISLEVADAWHKQFMIQKIEPMLLPRADELLQQHRHEGDRLLIITATNSYITAPIAARLGVTELIACDAEVVDGHYTGRSTGIPSYAEGKVTRLQQWLEQEQESLVGSVFYSDSHNDLPLLSLVERPVAVDPDDTLRAHADAHGWPVISLRD